MVFAAPGSQISPYPHDHLSRPPDGVRVIISVGEFGQGRRLNGETRAGIAVRCGDGQTTRLQSGVLPLPGWWSCAGVVVMLVMR